MRDVATPVFQENEAQRTHTVSRKQKVKERDHSERRGIKGMLLVGVLGPLRTLPFMWFIKRPLRDK